VLWRDPETGRQTSLTYDDEREAKVAKELIEAAGGYATEAARIAEAVRKPGPTVRVISEHIDLLTGVGPTRGRSTARCIRPTGSCQSADRGFASEG